MKDFFDKLSNEKAWRMIAAIALVILALTGGSGAAKPALDGLLASPDATEEAVARGSGFNTKVYFEQGGAKLVAASGGEIEVQSGATLDIQSGSTLSFAAGAVDAAAIANISRTVSLPLNSFIECTTNAGALIGFDTTADALPDFVNSSTDGLGFVIAWDDTGGSLDTGYICNTVQVPADYVSGGAVVMVIGKDGVTTNAESMNCQGSINGAALGTLGTVVVTTSTVTSYTCTPTLTGLAAGNSLDIALYVTAASSTPDDFTNLYSAAFVYTATQ